MKNINVQFTKENLAKKELIIVLTDFQIESMLTKEEYNTVIENKNNSKEYLHIIGEALYNIIEKLGFVDVSMNLMPVNDKIVVTIDLKNISTSEIKRIVLSVGYDNNSFSKRDHNAIETFRKLKHTMVIYTPSLYKDDKFIFMMPNQEGYNDSKNVTSTLKRLGLKKCGFTYNIGRLTDSEKLDGGFIKVDITFNDLPKALKRLKELMKSEEILYIDSTEFTINRVYEFIKKKELTLSLPIINEINKDEEVACEEVAEVNEIQAEEVEYKTEEIIDDLNELENISLDIVNRIYSTSNKVEEIKEARISHLKRVLSISRDISKNISRPNSINQRVITISALCHDIAKFIDNDLHGEIGSSIFPIYAERYFNLTKDEIKTICHIIKGHNKRNDSVKIRERKIISDADLIDKISISRFDRAEITKSDLDKFRNYENKLYFDYSKKLFKHRLLVLEEYLNY